MSTYHTSTRRSFMAIAGAALSVPVAAAAAHLPVGGDDPDAIQARLAMLEDLSAIRELNQASARHVSTGTHDELRALFAEPSAAQDVAGLCGISADAIGEDDQIEIAPDRQSATARLRRTVHRETVIGPSCPLVEMAREQGGGVVTWTETGVFENVYVRREGIWKIQRMSCQTIRFVAPSFQRPASA